MKNKNQNGDDFGTFLQSVQSAVNPSEITDTSTVKIMSVLSKLGQVEVVQLMSVVAMSWTEFSSGIQSLQSAGLVTVEDASQGGGKVQLTADGKSWAQVLNDKKEA